jgi:hypothetical protein
MRRLPISPLAAWALIQLAALNLVALIWLARIASEDAEVTVVAAGWAPAGAPPPEKSAPALKPSAAYQATLSHPVFFKTRRPYAPPPPPPPPVVAVLPPPPPAPPPDPQLTLAGVTIAAGVKKAYLVPKANPAGGSWVMEGDEIGGWRVGTITDAAIALENAGRTLQLLLYDAPKQ